MNEISHDAPPIEIFDTDKSIEKKPVDEPELEKPVEQPTSKIKTREDQLAESQKLVPLQMRSSFLPSETCPRDVIAVRSLICSGKFEKLLYS